MHRFYSVANPRSSGQLQSLSHYRDQELLRKQNPGDGAVDADGSLLEYEALELRLHPPNVRIDNENPNHTVLIIDSANRPGTLVEVVQCLTELGLAVVKARISSDGGWFVDEFHVSETPCGRVTDPKKLAAIKQVLSLPEHTGEAVEVHTVFQIAGPETPGLLAEVTQLLSHNGLQIRTAAAWTFNTRAAIVIGVTEHGAAVQDRVKLARLQQLLTKLVETAGDNVAVSVEQVEGPVHHERRLHQLLLADEVQAWKQLSRLQRQHSLPFPGPINTTAAQPADIDSEPDQQVPSTPKQQWQKRMLPPLWSVDSGGKPYEKEDLRQVLRLQDQLQQQQQQQQQQPRHPQQQWLADMQHGLAEAAEGDGSPFAVEAAAAAGGGDLAPETPAKGATAAARSSTTLPTVTSGEVSMQQPVVAAPITIDSTAADRAAAAAAAAAAAQQASVDKLIALLQPPGPLVHAISLPPDKKQQQKAHAAAMAAGAAGQQQLPGTHSQQPHGAAASQQQQQQRHVQDAYSQEVTQSKTAPLPQLAVTAAADAGAGGPGLPPRAPPVHTGPGILPPAQLVIPTSGPAGLQGRQQLSSLSAPSSPSIGPRGAAGPGSTPSMFAAGAAGSGAGAAGQQPWSPRGLASASAAAGLLSPRAAPGAARAGVMGLQQQQQVDALRQQSVPVGSPVASVLDAPEVQIQHSGLFNYWLVEIRCRDRNKLFFDTVCTLSDMRFDIYHATIDSEACGLATQLFYIRPRFGECVWDERRAAVLKAMLVSAVQRRFPPGLRLHVFSGSTMCLQDLVSSFKRHRLTITRCKVRAYDHASHTFYLLNQDGSLPSRQYVQMACQAAGGELVESPLDVSNPCVSTVLRSLDARGRFAFSFVTNRAYRAQGAVRGVLAPGGPIDISTGVLVGRGDGGVHGGAGRRGGVLGMLRMPEQAKLSGTVVAAPAPAAASYNSDQQPSF